MDRMFKALVVASTLASLSACVTQNYEENDKPVVANESSNDEIAMTRISLGLGYLKMGNTTQAKFNLEKAKSFSPNLVEVYTAFAHYYESVGEDEQTVESYEKALSLKPDDANTLNNYGVYLCRKKRIDEAEVQFLRAIKVPTYIRVSESYENLALCQLEALNFEKTELYLSKAIDHSPSDGSVLYQMMRFQYAIGQHERALGYSQRFEKSSRRFSAEFLALAYKNHLKLGNTKIASNYASMLVKMYPESWHAKQYLLNGLAQIDADELAEQYQMLTVKENQEKSNKKLVVLSPKSTKPPIKINRKKKAPSQVENIVQEQGETIQRQAQAAEPIIIPRKQSKRIVSQKAPSQQDVAAVKKMVKKKPVVVLKAPPRKGAKTLSPNTDMTVDEQLAALETVTSETAALARQSTGDLIDQVAQSVDSGAQDVNENSDAALGDDSLEALLAEAEALLSEEELQAMNAATDEYSTSSAEQSLAEQAIPTQSIVEAPPTELQTVIAEPEINTQAILSETLADLTAEELPEQGNLTSSELSEQQVIADEPVIEESLEDLPVHIMAEDENLFTLSKRYNIHLRALRKWNNLDERSLLKVGDRVYLADPQQIAGKE